MRCHRTDRPEADEQTSGPQAGLVGRPVDDRGCAAFLQRALPQRDLRWPGFRKVRRQVCKRPNRRSRELGLDDLAAYRSRLEADPAEWRAFDECCLITISRVFRDRRMFEVLRKRVPPAIAARVAHERRVAYIWSAVLQAKSHAL
jgi:chemotaxis protein methyltransferase CheR